MTDALLWGTLVLFLTPVSHLIAQGRPVIESTSHMRAAYSIATALCFLDTVFVRKWK